MESFVCDCDFELLIFEFKIELIYLKGVNDYFLFRVVFVNDWGFSFVMGMEDCYYGPIIWLLLWGCVAGYVLMGV